MENKAIPHGDSRTNLYREVTDRIILKLEQGRLPWVRPWGQVKTSLGLPKNALTGKRCSGVVRDAGQSPGTDGVSEQIPFMTEPTPEGEQCLVPGVTPITQRQRIEALIAAPLMSRRAQKPLNIGLFDENARRQMELF
jgi:hypothetical protein